MEEFGRSFFPRCCGKDSSDSPGKGFFRTDTHLEFPLETSSTIQAGYDGHVFLIVPLKRGAKRNQRKPVSAFAWSKARLA